MDQKQLAKQIGARLREARKRAELTQQEAGERAGFPPEHAQSRISHYERGRNNITLSDLAILAEIYRADPVSIAFGVRNIPTEEERFVRDFRLLPDDTKRIIRAILDTELRNHKAKKGRSS